MESKFFAHVIFLCVLDPLCLLNLTDTIFTYYWDAAEHTQLYHLVAQITSSLKVAQVAWVIGLDCVPSQKEIRWSPNP